MLPLAFNNRHSALCCCTIREINLLQRGRKAKALSQASRNLLTHYNKLSHSPFFWLQKALSYSRIPMIKIILPITALHSTMHSQLCNAINYAWMVCLPHSKLQGKLFPLKGLVSLKCTGWQEAKGSWCLRTQDWAVACVHFNLSQPQ